MLTQFTFNNYKCFKEETDLNFVASSSKGQDCAANGLLKVLTVYGANASGKTKLFDAMQFMRCVICPPKRDEKIPVFDFWQTRYDAFRLNTYSSSRESSFEVVLILDKTQYRYGFTLDRTRVVTEWLYMKKRRETLVFSREDMRISLYGNHINDRIFKAVQTAGMISSVVPLLSIMATFSDPLSKLIVDWFESITIISANDLRAVHLLDADKKGAIVKFMKAFDINIEDMIPHEVEYDSIPDKIKFLKGDKPYKGKLVDGVQTVHTIYDEYYNRTETTRFSLETDESFGTNRLLGMAWPIIRSLNQGTPLFIDEFDSGIHPFIIRAIINMYYRGKTTAQLVINTHNTSLLSAKDGDGRPLFRKDQIYVVNKNRYGESALIPITDFDHSLRANLEKIYLDGDISGVPFVDAESLFPEKE